MNMNTLNQAIDQLADRSLALSRKLRQHPIVTSMVSLAVVAIAAFTIASYCASPQNPQQLHDAENARIAKNKMRPLPYPILRVEIEAEGNYTIVGLTFPMNHPYEQIDGKLRVLVPDDRDTTIWEANDADTLESKTNTDSKLADALKAVCANPKLAGRPAPQGGLLAGRPTHGNYTYETYMEQFATNEHCRVSFAPSQFATPRNTPVKDAITLITNHDPLAQSFIDTSNNYQHQHENSQANFEYVKTEDIAKELLADPKLTNPTRISLREEVEKLGVKHRRQTSYDCSVYSAYHLLDFHMKRGDISFLTFEQFMTMMPKSAVSSSRSYQACGDANIIQVISKTQPDIRIKIRELTPFGKQKSFTPDTANHIFLSFIQHELSVERPLWARVNTGNDCHQIMIVGYDPDKQAFLSKGILCGGITALDSTGYGDGDHGYSSWAPGRVEAATSFQFINTKPK